MLKVISYNTGRDWFIRPYLALEVQVGPYCFELDIDSHDTVIEFFSRYKNWGVRLDISVGVDYGDDYYVD